MEVALRIKGMKEKVGGAYQYNREKACTERQQDYVIRWKPIRGWLIFVAWAETKLESTFVASLPTILSPKQKRMSSMYRRLILFVAIFDPVTEWVEIISEVGLGEFDNPTCWIQKWKINICTVPEMRKGLKRNKYWNFTVSSKFFMKVLAGALGFFLLLNSGRENKTFTICRHHSSKQKHWASI